MPAYDGVYYDDIIVKQGQMFLDVRDELKGVDEKWFIEKYMRSHIRSLLDHANPKFAAMPSLELIDYFVREELGGKYRQGEEWGGFLPKWVGQVYGHYQWKYNVLSSRLIDLLPLSDMEKLFVPGHQMGWDAAVDKIHDLLTDSAE
jgi:hypothetical protein